MTSGGRDGGLRGLSDSMALCIRRGGPADGGPGDLSPTMRIREACRRDRRSAAADRPLLIDVVGDLPTGQADRTGRRPAPRPSVGLAGRTCLSGRQVLRALAKWITG